MYKNCKLEKRSAMNVLLILGLLMSWLVFLGPHAAYASDGYTAGKLTDLFYTDSFTGNWEVLTKMNGLGRILSLIISVFSFIGLFTVSLRTILTMLYLSSKNLWDNVDEIKSAGKGQSMFGMPEMFRQAYNSKYGTGLDAFVSFFLSLLPNIKAYSDYATDAKHKNNYSETDTTVNYLLKGALPNIMIIFAFTMGFNGTLWQAYGVVVEAMGTVAETFVDSQLSQLVERAINTGSGYTFAYDADGTKYGAYKQSVCKKIYTSALKHCIDLTSDTKITVGSSIDATYDELIDVAAVLALAEAEPAGNETAANTTNFSLNGYSFKISDGKISGIIDSAKNSATVTDVANSITDTQANNLQYNVIVNSNPSYSDESVAAKPLSDLGLTNGGNALFVHLYITKTANSDEHNYVSVERNSNLTNGSTSDSSTLSGDDSDNGGASSGDETGK